MNIKLAIGVAFLICGNFSNANDKIELDEVTISENGNYLSSKNAYYKTRTQSATKTVEVKGTFDGFATNKFAFLGTTDLKGEIEITALRSGKWILMTKSKKAYENDNCDEVAYSSTLTFQVK